MKTKPYLEVLRIIVCVCDFINQLFRKYNRKNAAFIWQTACCASYLFYIS